MHIQNRTIKKNFFVNSIKPKRILTKKTEITKLLNNFFPCCNITSVRTRHKRTTTTKYKICFKYVVDETYINILIYVYVHHEYVF